MPPHTLLQLGQMWPSIIGPEDISIADDAFVVNLQSSHLVQVTCRKWRERERKADPTMQYSLAASAAGEGMDCSNDDVRSLFNELASSICKDAQSKRVRDQRYFAVLCPRRLLLGTEAAERHQFASNGVRTAFDVVLLRRSSWYPRYRGWVREGMSSASRCHGEAYCLKAAGRREEGARLDRLLKQLEANGQQYNPSPQHSAPLPHPPSPSHAELLVGAAGPLLHVLWRLRRTAPLDHTHWEGPRVLPLRLPLNSMSAGVDLLLQQSELFTRQPGSGFRGFFSQEVGAGPVGAGRGSAQLSRTYTEREVAPQLQLYILLQTLLSVILN